MDTKRKIIVLARHGDTPVVDGKRQDALTDESVRNIYGKAESSLAQFVIEYGVTPQRTFLRHSDKRRTVYTGKAILAGALGLRPIPQSSSDLDTLDFSDLDIQEHSGLGYEGSKYNEPVLMKNPEDYLVRWFANPRATTYECVEITPYQKVIDSGRKTLVDALGIAISGERDLGVVATHSSIVEALTLAAVNSARKNPAANFDEIGGLFEREGFATILLDQKEKAGTYKARLERDGESYEVNVSNLGF
ncbi:hypothetical protein J4462_00650 [Candidatus Pacearchaeota archaeon]|nr:hypothetical protein [Candidatus Pacearchaeota archaeon]